MEMMKVYIHEALHLRDKVQDAGYKALVEKWDSDSDSDASDDEADLIMMHVAPGSGRDVAPSYNVKV